MNPNVPEWMNTRARSSLFSVNDGEDVVALVEEHGQPRNRRDERDDQPGALPHARTAAGTGASTCSRCQSSSISRHQSRWPWSARPSAWSSRRRCTAAGRSWPRARARSSSSASAASSRSSPRNQREIGTPKPVFPRPDTSGGSASAIGAAQSDLAAAPLHLQRVRQRHAELEHLVVEERRAELERVRHRGDVGLEQQVAGEVGADVEPLEPRDALAGGAEELPGRRRLAHERRLPELGAQLGREDLHQPPVAGRRGQRGDLEEAAGAVRARARLPSPGPAQRPRREPGPGHRDPARDPDRRVPLVPGERLVAAVARERHGDVPARELARRRTAAAPPRRRAARRTRRPAGAARSATSGSTTISSCSVAVALGDRPRVRALVVAVVRRTRR